MSIQPDVPRTNTNWGQARDVIEARLDELEADSGTSGSGIRNVSGTLNLTDEPGIVEVYATASATVEGVALAAGDAAVFRYLSGAWTYMVVGTHTTWQSISATPVTANVPTADDTANTITWTPKTGVQYVIAGSVRTPPYSVGDVTATVVVTAQATAGYTLTGTSSWTFNFTGSAPADTTPPNPGTLAVTGTGDAGTTRTLTVTGASDAVALHGTPYRFSTDGGTTWSTYQSSNVFVTGALAAGTYQPRVMVRDAAGNTATATAADFTLTASGPTLLWEETFTYPDGTDMVGKAITLTTGGTATIQQSSTWFAANLIGVAGKPCPVASNRAVAPVATGDKTGGGINPAAWSGLDAAVEIVYDVTAAANAAAGLNMTSSAAAYRVFGDGRLFRGGTQVSTGHPTTGTLRLEHTGGDTITAKIDGVVVDTVAEPQPRVTGTFGIDRAAAVDTFRGWLL